MRTNLLFTFCASSLALTNSNALADRPPPLAPDRLPLSSWSAQDRTPQQLRQVPVDIEPRQRRTQQYQYLPPVQNSGQPPVMFDPDTSRRSFKNVQRNFGSGNINQRLNPLRFDSNELPMHFDPSKSRPSVNPSSHPSNFSPPNHSPNFNPSNQPPNFNPSSQPPNVNPPNQPSNFNPSSQPPDVNPPNQPSNFNPSNPPPNFDPSNTPRNFDQSKLPANFDPTKLPHPPRRLN
jgi:hypothetical protein